MSFLKFELEQKREFLLVKTDTSEFQSSENTFTACKCKLKLILLILSQLLSVWTDIFNILWAASVYKRKIDLKGAIFTTKKLKICFFSQFIGNIHWFFKLKNRHFEVYWTQTDRQAFCIDKMTIMFTGIPPNPRDRSPSPEPIYNSKVNI